MLVHNATVKINEEFAQREKNREIEERMYVGWGSGGCVLLGWGWGSGWGWGWEWGWNDWGG